MKIYKATLILALVLILLTGISAISAQDFNETLSVSEDTADNVELTTTQEGSDLLANESSISTNSSEVTNNETQEDDKDTLTIQTGPTHSESHKIVLDTKLSANKIKLNTGDLVYTITIRNNNVFDVRDIELKYGENDFYVLTASKSYSGVSDIDGTITISKLEAFTTKTYKFYLEPFAAGKATLDIHLNPKVAPYDDVSPIKTVVKAPKTVKKSKKYQAKITIKVNKQPAKSAKVKVKVYTGKKYRSFYLKANKKGIIKFSVKKFKKGKHKFVFSSFSDKYSIKKTLKVKIK